MIKIQKAKVGEVMEIKALLYKTWTATYSRIYSPEAIDTVTTEWHSPELLTKQIRDPKVSFIVAKDGKKIVGMCNVSFSPKNNVINIQRLHVIPRYQRQRIGSRLIRKAMAAFPAAKTVELEVEEQNYNAIAFYKKQGFKAAGEKVFTVKNVRLLCVVMRKSIIML